MRFPPQFAAAVAALSAGEASNGGQQFDVLLTAPPLLGGHAYWTLDLSNEVGNLDGITALNVTDIGAVPEPAGLGIVAMLLGLLGRRRRGGKPIRG
jgi:hypothetical protein